MSTEEREYPCGGSDDPQKRCGRHHATDLASITGGYECCCGKAWINKRCSTGAKAGERVSMTAPNGESTYRDRLAHRKDEEAAERAEALNSGGGANERVLGPAEVGRAKNTLRTSLREIVRECGLKQAFIADRMGTTEKHLSALLLGKNTLTVEWAQRIVDVCRQPLRLDIKPTEWVDDVVMWRTRAEAAEAKLAAYEVGGGAATSLAAWDAELDRLRRENRGLWDQVDRDQHSAMEQRGRADRAEAILERSRRALAEFDSRLAGGRWDFGLTPGEVLAAWHASLGQPAEEATGE